MHSCPYLQSQARELYNFKSQTFVSFDSIEYHLLFMQFIGFYPSGSLCLTTVGTEENERLYQAAKKQLHDSLVRLLWSRALLTKTAAELDSLV